MGIKRGVKNTGLLIFVFTCYFLLIGFASATITVISPASNSNHSTSAVFNVSFINGTDYANDVVNATFYYNLSGVWTSLGTTTDCNKNDGSTSNFSSCNSTITLPTSSEGKYSINATLNSLGSSGASVITTNVIFDNKAPAVSFSGVANTVYYGGTYTLAAVNVSVVDNGMGINRVYFNVTASNGTQVYWVRGINSGNYYNITFDTSVLAEGYYNVTVYANDTQLGNLNKTEFLQIVVDRTSPTASLSKSSSTTTSITVATSCTDATSGVATCTLSSSGGTVSGSTISGLSCSAGYIITLNAADNSGNSASNSRALETESCASDGVIIVLPPQKIVSFASINPETPVKIENFNSDIGIKEIQIEVNIKAEDVKFIITGYNEKPEGVLARSGIVNQYLQVETQNLNERLAKAIVQFRVEKSWVESNGLQKENIVVYKLDDSANVWNELTTTFKSEDSNYYYYNAEIDSFSYFAIAKEETTSSTADVIEGDALIPKEETSLKGIGIIIILALIGLIIFLIFKKKKKKK